MNQDKANKTLYNSLKELGLGESEINLYTISLRLGPDSITTIAKHLKISRPNVYKVIRGLERHGLAKFSERSKYARDFMVEPPTTILEKLREKKENVSLLDNDLVADLPNLLALYHQGETPTKIKILQGKEQYLKVFNQSVEEAEHEMQFFGSAEDFIHFVSWETELNWIKQRLKNDIGIKVLILPSGTAEQLKQKDAEEKRETRVLKDSPSFPTSFLLFSNKVVFWQPKAPLAVVVEDQYIAQMMGVMFSRLWNASA